MESYKNLAQEAYKTSNEDREQNIADWKRIGGSEYGGVYQNQKTGEINQGISGSRNISDFISDLFLQFGIKNKHYRRREAEAEEMARRISRVKGSNKHTITSHSLGSNLSNELISKDLVDKAINFNPYITHHDYKKAKHHKVTNIRNKGDIASILTRNNNNTKNLNYGDNKYSDISSHFIKNINL